MPEHKFESAQLSVIVPILNERDNIRPLVTLLKEQLAHISWEVIFVDDDSKDGSAGEVIDLARQDPRIRLIERIDRSGLASACIEGFLSSTAPLVAVMDGDLQHDSAILPQMVSELDSNPKLDLVIGSRFVEGGEIKDWSRARLFGSRLGEGFSRWALPQPVQDPMSGFFMLRKNFFKKIAPSLSGRGFKILLDILITAGKNCAFKEIPYQFQPRKFGKSKLSIGVLFDFSILLFEKTLGRRVPARFLMFLMVGSVGMVVHLLVLAAFYKTGSLSFWASQFSAAGIAMVSNFILNNTLTFYDKTKRDWDFVSGLLLFVGICGIGLFINLRIAIYLFDIGADWWLAGILGAAIGSVWNFAINTTYNWREPSREP